jgi:predicted phosphohydrolase
MAKTIKKIAGYENNKRFYRKFGNHEYWNSGEVSSKLHAEKRAKELRNEYFVRITKSTIGVEKGWYAIWVSPKKGD